VDYEYLESVNFKAVILKEDFEYGHDGDIDDEFD
jgi:hypothetical protein